MFLIIPSWPRCPVCKAVSAVGNTGRHSSLCTELCTQTPPLKLGSHQLGLWPRAPLGWEALGGAGSVSTWPIWKRIGPIQTRWSPCPALKVFPALGLEVRAAFLIRNLKETQQDLFSALGGEGLQKCVFTVAGGCVFTQFDFNFENAAIHLHCWWTGIFPHGNTFVHTVFILF